MNILPASVYLAAGLLPATPSKFPPGLGPEFLSAFLADIPVRTPVIGRVPVIGRTAVIGRAAGIVDGRFVPGPS